jgi:hypothetical protein
LASVIGSSSKHGALLDLAVKVLACHKFRDVVIIRITILIVLGHVLVALSKLAQGSERVRAQLVEDARDQFCELFVLASPIDGEGVWGHSGMDWTIISVLESMTDVTEKFISVRMSMSMNM